MATRFVRIIWFLAMGAFSAGGCHFSITVNFWIGLALMAFLAAGFLLNVWSLVKWTWNGPENWEIEKHMCYADGWRVLQKKVLYRAAFFIPFTVLVVLGSTYGPGWLAYSAIVWLGVLATDLSFFKWLRNGPSDDWENGAHGFWI